MGEDVACNVPTVVPQAPGRKLSRTLNPSVPTVGTLHATSLLADALSELHVLAMNLRMLDFHDDDVFGTAFIFDAGRGRGEDVACNVPTVI